MSRGREKYATLEKFKWEQWSINNMTEQMDRDSIMFGIQEDERRINTMTRRPWNFCTFGVWCKSITTKKSWHVVEPLEGIVDVGGLVPYVNVTRKLVAKSVKIVVDRFSKCINFSNQLHKLGNLLGLQGSSFMYNI